MENLRSMKSIFSRSEKQKEKYQRKLYFNCFVFAQLEIATLKTKREML